ncbi:MAG: hypothetical protein UU65_C0002G0255 [candidate division CPR2 bacterium GW2011_GWC1_41_48]|uniref:DUF4342 domain-containing protein n=1 Tax=candidate division CPR2 bacterium GW2011_GWC1_41_48 TaxID=1618344 RepID=A0A0G0WBM1_UNCC2|nr:MAG: hypothetical protein UT47_C0002G0049 [candidate division CPR2 bacterium GW2011_GWC2_39_35]KKR28980.1 MAG: hypothetical protein UT60_C0008G0023 [candidate division CPR2 bacterium GW2011_GWD2_39_7]KKR29256.1 MAG: hypothetical protein UT59_C0010G0008 [candidate division CPR2 bacterium GW2011_GWD1_39_7]KKS09477.1 MAG: hypothetical protein UU65_C0002G0255 [candidate division CPR2 bacterium GW2011_GWC1_41_48]OGB62185.1 MAG: hypothetical protein A2Y27_00755 [candidate division CPR2 bacterium G
MAYEKENSFKDEEGKKEEVREEVFRVSQDQIVNKVNEIIKEGNARRIIVQNEKGETVMEFPLTVGIVGAVLAPILAAAGALAALVTRATIIVEKKG